MHGLNNDQINELQKIHTQIQALTRRAADILARAASAGTDPDKSPDSSDLIPGTPVVVYTDGACSGNPGPAGSGVVIMQEERIIHEISRSLGKATNNIAELTAIKLALEYLQDGHQGSPITLYSDSTYCIGLLTKNWKAKANVELVAELRELAAGFASLTIRHVKGHSGHPGNERADELAVRGASR